MKGLLITIALILGVSFYLLTSYDTVAGKIVDGVAAEEQNHDAMMAALAKDDKAFLAKYTPLFERRWSVANPARILDEAYFMKLSKETLDLYQDTPLMNHEDYGSFLFERAKRLEETANPQTLYEAWTLYKKYMELFPSGEKVTLVRNAISRMTTKYGMQ